MNVYTVPFIKDYDKTGSSSLGYITPIQELPFPIKRVYWTYYSPHDVIRGFHAHKQLQQLIFAISGVIEFNLENTNSETFSFKLEKPNTGLYIPPMYWRTMKFSHNAILLCMASEVYNEDDYIRDYEKFLKS